MNSRQLAKNRRKMTTDDKKKVQMKRGKPDYPPIKTQFTQKVNNRTNPYNLRNTSDTPIDKLKKHKKS